MRTSFSILTSGVVGAVKQVGGGGKSKIFRHLYSFGARKACTMHGLGNFCRFYSFISDNLKIFRQTSNCWGELDTPRIPGHDATDSNLI